MEPGRVLAVGLLLLCVACAARVRVPCLEGSQAQTAADVLRDDWACTTYCQGPSSSWSATCRRCCPRWLGGDGIDAPSAAGGQGGGSAATSGTGGTGGTSTTAASSEASSSGSEATGDTSTSEAAADGAGSTEAPPAE